MSHSGHILSVQSAQGTSASDVFSVDTRGRNALRVDGMTTNVVQLLNVVDVQIIGILLSLILIG